jgi:hypothetical protein
MALLGLISRRRSGSRISTTDYLHILKWDERSWPPADARVSLRQDTSQECEIAREAGARRTYLLESALVVHGLPLAELQAFDPAALRGRIESEHLAEAALDSLKFVPICGTCAAHKGDPT